MVKHLRLEIDRQGNGAGKSQQHTLMADQPQPIGEHI
jgi:hypothetical protein